MADTFNPARKIGEERTDELVDREDDIPFDVLWFNKFGKLTALWLWQSKSLYESAELVMLSRRKEASTLFNVPLGMMLGSYAIETLLKAAQLAELNEKKQEKIFFSSARQMHSTSHDLNKLVDGIAIRVSKKDRNLLSELTEHAVWKGRYPIPMTAKEYKGPALYGALKAALRGKSPARNLGAGIEALQEARQTSHAKD
ncbi:MAG TPA: hypothetical protein VG328_22525 [Stellaceae bacterium]|jgi:hypothetical protein|nr:hypothetical protein [Stellaceae bacterium]